MIVKVITYIGFILISKNRSQIYKKEMEYAKEKLLLQ